MQRAPTWLRRTRMALGLSPLLLLCDPLRHAVESRMLLHMLVEFPALLASGWVVARLWRAGAGGFDEQGLFGITAVLCVSVSV